MLLVELEFNGRFRADAWGRMRYNSVLEIEMRHLDEKEKQDGPDVFG